MNTEIENFQLIESSEQLKKFVSENKSVDWMSFDTEFVGERRFHTTICLIQAATSKGSFIVDPLAVEDISPFFELLENRDIIKITHAGDNDYRLFYQQYNVLPRNVVDTQITAAFVGYKYPVSFRKLVESELNITLNKGFTVADWETRPLQKKHLKYALYDVLYLHDLWKFLFKKLDKLGRVDWALEECAQLETADFYEIDPDRETLESPIIKGLHLKEQVFLLRFYRWRREEAKRLNLSKEMVLQGKMLNMILRTIPGGFEALSHNRRIPENITKKYGQLFDQMFDLPPTVEEERLLQNIPADKTENPRQDILTEMLDLIIKFKCLDHQIAHEIVMPRGILKRMKTDCDYFDPLLENGWRGEFLGKELTNWLHNRTKIDLNFQDEALVIKLLNDE